MEETTEKAKYWRSGDVARVQEGEEGIGTEDHLMKAGEIRQVGRAWAMGGRMTTNALRRPANNQFSSCDPWTEMKLEFTGPAGFQLSLDRYLETIDGPIRADQNNLDGRSCIRLRFSTTNSNGGKANIAIWHDIGYNYLVPKLVSEHPETNRRSVCQVTDFIEPEPGVVFPVRAGYEVFDGDRLYQSRVTTLTDVVINKPILAVALVLPAIPRGTELQDKIAGREGPIDTNWNWTGPTKALPPRLVKVGSADPATSDAAPSTSEPTSTARWVLLGSVMALFIAVGLTVVGRLRRRERPDL